MANNDNIAGTPTDSFADDFGDSAAGSTRYHRNGTSTVPTASRSATITPDMMAVARKLRDRARTLEEERRRVESAEPVLASLRDRRREERAVNDQRRKHLLERVNERNAVELEVLSVRDAIADHHTEAAAASKEAVASEERLRELLEHRRNETVTFYGPNLARMEACAIALEAVVESKERAVRRKRSKLEGIRTDLENAKAEEARIRRDTDSIREEMARDETEGKDNPNAGRKQEDEEITALSKRVRETIEERSDLRKKLKQARIEYNRANEEMLSWEEKRIEMTAKKR